MSRINHTSNVKTAPPPLHNVPIYRERTRHTYRMHICHIIQSTYLQVSTAVSIRDREMREVIIYVPPASPYIRISPCVISKYACHVVTPTRPPRSIYGKKVQLIMLAGTPAITGTRYKSILKYDGASTRTNSHQTFHLPLTCIIIPPA